MCFIFQAHFIFENIRTGLMLTPNNTNKLLQTIVLSSQQWCQKLDVYVSYSGDSFIVFIKQLYLNIHFLILNKYNNNILISKSFISTLPTAIIEVCLMSKKRNYNIFKNQL